MSGTSAILQDISMHVLQQGTTTTNETLNNSASSMASSFGTATELGPVVVFVVYAAVALGAAQYAAPWLVQSELLSGIGSVIAHTVVYAIKGMAASVVLAVVAAPFYFLATLEPSTRGMALEAVGYGIAAILVLAGLGWLADRAVAAFIDAHPDYDEWGELFPEEEPDAVGDGGDPDE